MFNTLTEILTDEPGIKQLMEMSFRLTGVLVAATLVFVALYFFIASLEVPVIHS